MHFSPKFMRLGQNNAAGGVTGAGGGDLGDVGNLGQVWKAPPFRGERKRPEGAERASAACEWSE